MEKKIICPFCGEENVEFVSATNEWNVPHYHCKSCDSLFEDEDVVREILRRKIGMYLFATDDECNDEHIMNVNIILPSYEESAVGLSSLQIPYVSQLIESMDGVIYYHIAYFVDDNGDEIDLELDKLETKDIQAICSYLEEKYADKVTINFEN